MRNLTVAALLSSGPLSFLAGTAPAQSTPNVLVLVADDLSPEHVGCYAPGAPPTPHLDALAANGVRFTRAYANPMCSPTRATVMTGRHAFRTGVTRSLWPGMPGLTAEEFTLPRALSTTHAAGLIGKWHLGTALGASAPNLTGWSHFCGNLEGAVTNYWSWSRVFNGEASRSSSYVTTHEVDEALAWIQAQEAGWLAMVSFHAPHLPYHAPPAHLHTQNLAGLSPLTHPAAFYRAMVESMDAEIGRLFATLGPAVMANTLVVFLADNGAPSEASAPPAPRGRAKGSLYEGGVRVPLIITGPGVVSPGRTCDELVATVDLLPTILDLTGTTWPVAAPALDGVSLRPLLEDVAGPVRSHVYTEITASPFGGGHAVRDERWKLIRYLSIVAQRQELYDLQNDPDEQSNLLAGPMSAESTAALQGLEDLMAAVRNDGWVTLYGSGCPASVGDPLPRAYVMPRLGRLFIAGIDQIGPGAQTVFGLVGLSRQHLGGQPLPIDLGAFGMPGCALLCSADLLHLTVGPGNWWWFSMPVGQELVGARFFLQGLVVDPGANAAGLVTTPGLMAVIGL